jgi:hypothetical protein
MTNTVATALIVSLKSYMAFLRADGPSDIHADGPRDTNDAHVRRVVRRTVRQYKRNPDRLSDGLGNYANFSASQLNYYNNLRKNEK